MSRGPYFKHAPLSLLNSVGGSHCYEGLEKEVAWAEKDVYTHGVGFISLNFRHPKIIHLS